MVRGWARDHGPKDLFVADLTTLPISEEVETYKKDEVYLEPRKRQRPSGKARVITMRVSAAAQLALSGTYQIQIELSRKEIARLFLATNGDRELNELLETLAEFRDEVKEEDAA